MILLEGSASKLPNLIGALLAVDEGFDEVVAPAIEEGIELAEEVNEGRVDVGEGCDPVQFRMGLPEEVRKRYKGYGVVLESRLRGIKS